MVNDNSIIKAAVIGDPISHSLSPKIHNFLLQKYGLKGQYEAIKVEKGNLKSAIQSFVDDGFSGFNVTIPHKEEIFKICDFKSKTALLTGAVNTVVITENNKIFGHNSDAEGFINNLKYSQSDFDFKDKVACIIGAGGAARAIVYSLIKSGVKKIIITNRSESRVLELINDLSNFAQKHNSNLEFLNQKAFEAELENCDLLVNSTSLGMVGQPKLQIDLTSLSNKAIVYDIVYKPLMTDLLLEAQKRNNRIVTGIGMLIFQALIGFELWFKKKPEEKFITELFEILQPKS
jgi:shikimate dehydrogenase